MTPSSRAFSLLTAATLLALGLATSVQAQDTPVVAMPAATATALADGVLRRDLAQGVYEARYSAAADRLFVASSEAATETKGGVIYRLDPATLETRGRIYTDLRNFALAIDAKGETLYVTNSVERGLTAIDAVTGEVKARLRFDDKASDGTNYGPRQVILDEASGTLYVGGVGAPGLIWVVDAATLTLRATIGDAGKWVTGLLHDPAAGRLYAANGDGEVLVIDTASNEIQQRWTPNDGKEYLLLNLALDAATHRLFVTDHSKAATVLVFDTRTGEVERTLPVGDSMGIKLHPERKALYVTHREQGTVSELDSDTYAVRRTWSLPPNPNSLEIAPDGKALYVTVKAPFNKDYTASALESVVRIPLD